MKFFLIMFSLMIFKNAQATAINVACVTEYPTTSFVATTDGDIVNFRLIHHNGIQYMPIWSGVITPNDLPMLNEVSKTLKSLGEDLSFSMSLKNCNIQDSSSNLMFSCFGGQAPVDINGHKVMMWGVFTSHSIEKSIAGVYSNIWSNMALDIDGKTYYLPMKYTEAECTSENSKNNLKKELKNRNLFFKGL